MDYNILLNFKINPKCDWNKSIKDVKNHVINPHPKT